jgi:hypothetical protein
MQNEIIELLQSKGYEARLNDNGAIICVDTTTNFKCVINVDADDPQYVEVWTGSYYELGEWDKKELLEAANKITGEYKAGKVAIDFEHELIVFIAGMLIVNVDSFKELFERCKNTVQAMADNFATLIGAEDDE